MMWCMVTFVAGLRRALEQVRFCAALSCQRALQVGRSPNYGPRDWGGHIGSFG